MRNQKQNLLGFRYTGVSKMSSCCWFSRRSEQIFTLVLSAECTRLREIHAENEPLMNVWRVTTSIIQLRVLW